MKALRYLSLMLVLISTYTLAYPTLIKVENQNLKIDKNWQSIELINAGIILRSDEHYLGIKPITDTDIVEMPDGNKVSFKEIIIGSLTGKSALPHAAIEMFVGVFNYSPLIKTETYTLYIDKNNTLPDFVNAYLITNINSVIEITGKSTEAILRVYGFNG